MTFTASLLLSVMLLTDPSEVINAEAAAAVAEDADRVELSKPTLGKDERKTARIRSRASDFDRKLGVMMFEGNVYVEYGSDYVMCSDQLYMFLAGSNELSRVVAIGNVSITNETRVGTCALATYRRKRSEIEMFCDGTNTLARLVENGDDASALAGARIKFWLDSEQVEVDKSEITVQQEGEGNLL